MELLLWRWSTAVQLTSLVMITVFFVALARSARRVEHRLWVQAWLFNLAALSVTLGYWYFEPPPWTLPIVRGLYLAFKTAFVLLFLQGTWALLRPGARFVSPRYAVPLVSVFALAGAIFLNGVNPIGVAQALVMGVLFAIGSVVLARAGDGALTWLAAGLTIRALLAVAEAVAYALQVAGSARMSPELRDLTATFLSAHSSLDTAAEWLLALGCVLALSERAQRELRGYNNQLLTAQEDLRRLADRDPLTGLTNRRSLPDIFRIVQPKGATLLFFDLDEFKEINDLHGHHAGDECLMRFASALKESFRPDDAIVRYAGDEFLIVASGLDPAAAAERLTLMRDRLARTAGPEIRFSVGVTELVPGGDADAALEAADQAMYRAKATAGGRHLRLLKVAGR